MQDCDSIVATPALDIPNVELQLGLKPHNLVITGASKPKSSSTGTQDWHP